MGLKLFKIANLFPPPPPPLQERISIANLSLPQCLSSRSLHCHQLPSPLLLCASPITHYLLQTLNCSNYFFTFPPSFHFPPPQSFLLSLSEPLCPFLCPSYLDLSFHLFLETGPHAPPPGPESYSPSDHCHSSCGSRLSLRASLPPQGTP